MFKDWAFTDTGKREHKFSKPTDLYETSVILARKDVATPCFARFVSDWSNVLSIHLHWFHVVESYLIQVPNFIKEFNKFPIFLMSGLSCFGTHMEETSWCYSSSWMIWCAELRIIFNCSATSSIVTGRFFLHYSFHFNVSVRFIVSVRSAGASCIRQIWLQPSRAFRYLQKRHTHVPTLSIRSVVNIWRFLTFTT